MKSFCLFIYKYIQILQIMKFFGITSAFIAALVTVTSAVPTQIANDPDVIKFYVTAPLNNKVYSAGGV